MRMTGASWIKRLSLLVACTGVLSLPVLAQANEEDPWQGYNRFMFRINDNVDMYTLKPLAKGYQAVTPQFLEDGVHNVFRNIGDVGNLANNLLQAKFHDAGVDSSRLIFNTTFGLLGFFDVGTAMGLQRSDEDFGQTMGAWGLNSGPYVVLPLLGPSTVRDAFGKVPDSMLVAPAFIDHVPTRNVVRGVQLVDLRASLLSAERLISGDKYIFVRNAYLQNREFKVSDGEVEDDF
ncbi:phospholipid-binding lipoprotein MlaA [Pseudomonas guineae]|uniref:Phospholipid-binding lipoprotein MlaA n=1 Tax=Pseudomonas guineae TaxID=425504 RepID=A0A1I3JPN9_9PSED|nr:VacJ family lipoprotein [Pseudomonas guineae]SFI62126.1 phospholipid-binding lipoprotein MlaA [Pseudomonas guineae]